MFIHKLTIILQLCGISFCQLPNFLQPRQTSSNQNGNADFSFSDINMNNNGFDTFGQQPTAAGGFLTNQNGDRRQEDGWWHLYPFGAAANDAELGTRPNEDYQIDLDFDFPFYGFRFNYTMLHTGGMIAFSYARNIQPPFTFPNPRWPEELDASFIAPFLAGQAHQYIADFLVSHIWHRTVFRDRNRRNRQFTNSFFGPQTQQQTDHNRWSRVQDSYFLDNVTKDIQNGIIGAHGFQADYALVVTWERMGYGGAPKVTEVGQYHEVKRWLNTYQLVLATDEIRSYVMFNYAHINWTSSNTAGALRGRGGLQSAMVGFNGGNGTGWTPLPYSGEGRVVKLAEFSNVDVPGRWLYRVDEEIISGGCSNTSIGVMTSSPIAATMLGGVTVNVSGPCFRGGDNVKVIFDEHKVDCIKINTHRASCVLPIDRLYKIGLVTTRLSRDGGESYPYHGHFYILQPAMASPQVRLLDSPMDPNSRWHSPNATELSMRWAPVNLTSDNSAMVDISLWAYWENADTIQFTKIALLERNIPNDGEYSFNPSMMTGENYVSGYKNHQFTFGVIQISVSGEENAGVFWSKLTPFGWYFYNDWLREMGDNWALDLCIEWFEYDGRRPNFIMDLEQTVSCPCTLDQALLDVGRYAPLYGCDRDGDASCDYNSGSQHCVMSVAASWSGAGQVCCYDTEGWLMHSDDYEVHGSYLRFYSPGVPQRAHPWGAYPFKQPPYVPSLSNYYTDRLPYDICCRWAEHCELYYWRRQTSGCQEYHPPAAGYAYGEPHFVTFDGSRYSFQGKGYFVLTYVRDPRHNLMVQVRMEQPPRNVWSMNVNATVITGVAVQENDSDVVQILARKDFRRWRYRMDVKVQGISSFFDTPELKLQRFKGVSIYSPERNQNQSELIIMLDSGAGVRVSEAYGILDVMVLLPPDFNETDARFYNDQRYFESNTVYEASNRHKFVSMGLLGTFNANPMDDLMTPGGNIVQAEYPPSPNTNRRVYTEFGQHWRVDGSRYKLLFQENVNPIYNPLLFAEDTRNFMPIFDPLIIARNSTLLFSVDEVKSTCHGDYECQYDYFLTGRREIALHTFDIQSKLRNRRAKGSQYWISCGALLKSEGVTKFPPGQNYLDGVTVTFNCKPDFFLHGTAQRTCMNGRWTNGWVVWCRSRTLEYGLKWMTALFTSFSIILVIASIFIAMHLRRKKSTRQNQYLTQPIRPRQTPQPVQVAATPIERRPGQHSYQMRPSSISLAKPMNTSSQISMDLGDSRQQLAIVQTSA